MLTRLTSTHAETTLFNALRRAFDLVANWITTPYPPCNQAGQTMNGKRIYYIGRPLERWEGIEGDGGGHL